MRSFDGVDAAVVCLESGVSAVTGDWDCVGEPTLSSLALSPLTHPRTRTNPKTKLKQTCRDICFISVGRGRNSRESRFKGESMPQVPFTNKESSEKSVKETRSALVVLRFDDECTGSCLTL